MRPFIPFLPRAIRRTFWSAALPEHPALFAAPPDIEPGARTDRVLLEGPHSRTQELWLVMRAVRDFIAGFRALHFDRWVTCRSFFVRKVLLFKYSYALDSAVTVDVMPSSDSMFGRGVAGS